MGAAAVRPAQRNTPAGGDWCPVVALGAAVLPALVSWAIFWYLFPARPLWELLPSFPNDEVGYWHQIATFKEAGFGGGYYTYGEVPARWTVSRFGVHGPVFPILYGLVARVVGWTPSSGPFFNMGVLAVALFVASRIGRLTRRGTLLLALLVSTSWWVLILIPSTMQETVHQAIGIVLGALLGRLAVQRDRQAGWLLAAALVVLTVASLMRPPWALLFGPWLLLALRPRGMLRSALALASSVPAAGLAWQTWNFISASVTGGGVTWGALGEIGRLGGSPTQDAIQAAFGVFFSRLPVNVAAQWNLMLGATGPVFPEHRFFLVHVYYQAIGCLLIVVGAWLYARLRRLGTGSDAVQGYTELLVLWNVGLVFGLLLLIGAVNPLVTTRVFLPHLLLALVVTVVTGRRRLLVAAVIAANVAMSGAGLPFYEAFRAPAVYVDRERIERFRQDVSLRLAYDPRQPPWCNTVGVTIGDYATPMLTIPAGVGVSFLPERLDFSQRRQARYLVLPPPYAEQIERSTRLRLLQGTLYENLDVACASGPP